MFLVSLILSANLIITDIHEQYYDIEAKSDTIQQQLEQVYTQSQMNILAKRKMDLWEAECITLVDYLKSRDKTIVKSQDIWYELEKKRIENELVMYSGTIYDALYCMAFATAFQERAQYLLNKLRLRVKNVK